MKSKIIKSLLVFAVVAGNSVAWADQAVYSCPHADGSIELTSRPSSAKCELLVAAQPSASAVEATPSAAAVNSAPEQEKTAGQSAIPVVTGENRDGKDEADPRKAYRDAMIQGAQHAEGAPATAANPSVNRRYLKVDRAAYRQAIGADAAK
jgi:hypothetical protein